MINFLLVSDAHNRAQLLSTLYQIQFHHLNLNFTIYLIVPSEELTFWKSELQEFSYVVVYGFNSTELRVPNSVLIHKNHVSPIAYSKLFSHLILPTSVEKVLYLDTDILILRSLEELYNSRDDFAIMAVTDNYLGRSLQNWNRFNTGVMLMRLDIIRNISIGSETVVRAIENNRESKWADLEVFNELYAHKWSEISAVYNFMINGSDSLKPSDRALAIIHFAGLPKPWQIDSDSIVDYLWRYFAKLALEGNISENDVFREFTIRSVIMEIVRITPELSESHRGKSVHAYFALEESFESRLQTLEFELSENMVRIAEIQRENESLSLELDEQKNQNVNLNAELDAILNSAIWRISKPYRNLKNLIFGI